MKKDRNRPQNHHSDHSLPRSKILRGRKNFQRLFEKSTVLNSTSFQFRYRLYPDSTEGCYIGFAAPKKKISKAVKRNRAKRLLKEAYRNRQSYLQDLFFTNSFGFHGLFLANGDNFKLTDIGTDMDKVLSDVRQQIIDIQDIDPKSTTAPHKSQKTEHPK